MKMWTVAHFTLLRLWRTRYLSAGVILTILVFWAVPEREEMRSLRDLETVYALATYLTWLFAIWLGNGLFAADRADGNLRSTLTRPISSIEYVCGKVLGGFLAVLLLTIVFTMAITIGALLAGVDFRAAMVLYPLSLLPTHLMVLALSAGLAQWMPRFWAAMLMLVARDGLYTKQTLTRLTDFLPESFMAVLLPLAKVFYWLVPATSRVTVGFYDFFHAEKDVVMYLIFIPYSLHYALLVCLLAAWHLNREEL